MSELFAVQNLYKHYGDATVVNDVSFAIAPGECLGVIGPNGAGKTTTIRMCLGLTAPDSGNVLFYPEGAAAPLYMPRDSPPGLAWALCLSAANSSRRGTRSSITAPLMPK